MVEELSASMLESLLAAEVDVQVVDVRPHEAFETGHIPGAENVPFERLLRSIEAVDWHDRVVFVCPYGETSRQAAELLSAYERISGATRVYNLADGLLGWDGPLVREDTAESI